MEWELHDGLGCILGLREGLRRDYVALHGMAKRTFYMYIGRIFLQSLIWGFSVFLPTLPKVPEERQHWLGEQGKIII